MKIEDKQKLFNNIFKMLFWIFIISFGVLYISQATGYYEYELHKKVVLTEENIKKFEKDVAEGKNLSIESYLEKPNRNYQNKISSLGYNISSNIGRYVKDGIENTFKFLNRFIVEE